jgi:hypothetical protein
MMFVMEIKKKKKKRKRKRKRKRKKEKKKKKKETQTERIIFQENLFNCLNTTRVKENFRVRLM